MQYNLKVCYEKASILNSVQIYWEEENERELIFEGYLTSFSVFGNGPGDKEVLEWIENKMKK